MTSSVTPVSGARQQLLVRDHLVDQPEFVRLLGTERAAVEEQLDRLVVADPAPEGPARADLRDQADPAERGHEARASRGDDQVAGLSERQALGIVEADRRSRLDDPTRPAPITPRSVTTFSASYPDR